MAAGWRLLWISIVWLQKRLQFVIPSSSGGRWAMISFLTSGVFITIWLCHEVRVKHYVSVISLFFFYILSCVGVDSIALKSYICSVKNEGRKTRERTEKWAEGISHVRTSCCYWVARAVWSSAKTIVAHLAVKQPKPKGSHRRGANELHKYKTLFNVVMWECFLETWSTLTFFFF